MAASKADERSTPAPGRAVLWDMDGVLADTGPAHLASWQQIGRARGREVTTEDFRQVFGLRNREAIARLFGQLPDREVAALEQRKEEYFRDAIRRGLAPRPGLRRLLAELRRAGFAQAVASSAPPENVALILEVLGIAREFAAIVTGDDVRRGKPDPEVFLRAAAKLGVPPDRCVVVEDAFVGVAAAKAAGMRCVALVGTNPRERLQQADLVVDSLEELGARSFLALLDD